MNKNFYRDEKEKKKETMRREQKKSIREGKNKGLPAEKGEKILPKNTTNGKEVKDLMIGIFEYPHIPFWFSINQAVRIIKVSFINIKKYPEPMAILVFDEKYNLMGTLTLKDILKGLEPRFMSATTKAQVPEEDESGLALIWDSLFTKETQELAEKPVRDIMVPAKHFVDPNDPVTKAAYLMLHHDLILLPVLEDKKKFVGLVRMVEVFDEISNAIMSE